MKAISKLLISRTLHYLALLLIATSALAETPAPCDPSGATLTIGTQNLWHYPWHYSERLQALRDGVKQGLPSIMGFQEAWRGYGKKSLFDEYVHLTGHPADFYRRAYWGVMEEGIAIASAYPIQNDIALDLPHSNPLVKRLVIVSDIDSPIGLVHVLTTHLNPYGENTRREQMAYLVDLLNTFPHDEAIIVMGDLNDTMDSGLFDSLQKLGFRDIADGKMITYDPKNPYADGSPAAGLDHIFYRTTVLKEMDSGYLFKDKPVSDHYGVWGKFCRLE